MGTSNLPPTTDDAGVPVESDEHSPALVPDGPVRCGPAHTGAPYTPNSCGGPAASPQAYGDIAGWQAAGEMVREAYSPYSPYRYDDFGQPGTLVREVLDDAARDRLVGNVVGHLSDGVSAPVLERAFAYWRSIDRTAGDRIAQAVARP
ncbi:catalase-related domain-containing protein [Actinacidiphila reveromycinica]